MLNKSSFQKWFSPKDTASIGRQGEERAAEYLRKVKGMRVVARNWRSPVDRRDELDIVCVQGPLLVFVEVKTRYRGAMVRGYYTVNQRKKEALKRAAFCYLKGLRPQARPKGLRFDVVEVEHPWDRMSVIDGIIHLENIPLIKRFQG
jgi:putative endonuclease